MTEEWWTDDQKEIAEDYTRNWVKKTFRATQGYWLFFDGYKVLGKITNVETLPEGAVLDGSAWDHEHCRLCWGKISELPEYQHEGYTDEHEEDWICINCFDTYLAPYI